MIDSDVQHHSVGTRATGSNNRVLTYRCGVVENAVGILNGCRLRTASGYRIGGLSRIPVELDGRPGATVGLQGRDLAQLAGLCIGRQQGKTYPLLVPNRACEGA